MAQRRYHLGLVKDGYAISEYGLLRILDGCVLLCGTNLADFAKEFEGRWVEVAFASPNPVDETPFDPLIEPLVRKLQALGYTTVSSCQGHVNDPDIWWRHPFVTFWDRPDVPVADTWEVVQVGTRLWNLRAKGMADTQEELAELQSRIADQMAVLG